MATPDTTITQNTDGASGPAAPNGQGPEGETPSLSSQTQAVHAGEKRYISHDSVTVPIVQTSTYTFEDTASLIMVPSRDVPGAPPRTGGPSSMRRPRRRCARRDGTPAARVARSPAEIPRTGAR